MDENNQTDLEEFLVSIGRRHARLDPRGREVVDPTPIAPPVGYKRVPTLVEQLRQMVRSEALAKEAREAGFETFEDADDFDIADDPLDPQSRYEIGFEPPIPVAELRRRQAAEKAAGYLPDDEAIPRQGASQTPASGGGEAGLDGPDTP